MVSWRQYLLRWQILKLVSRIPHMEMVVTRSLMLLLGLINSRDAAQRHWQPLSLGGLDSRRMMRCDIMVALCIDVRWLLVLDMVVLSLADRCSTHMRLVTCRVLCGSRWRWLFLFMSRYVRGPILVIFRSGVLRIGRRLVCRLGNLAECAERVLIFLISFLLLLRDLRNV